MGDKIDSPTYLRTRGKTATGDHKNSRVSPESQMPKTGDDDALQVLEDQVKKPRPIQRISAKALLARTACMWDRMREDTVPVCDLIFRPNGKDRVTVHVHGAVTATLGSPSSTCILKIESEGEFELTHAMALKSAHEAITTLHPRVDCVNLMRAKQSVEEQLQSQFPVIEQSIHDMLPGVVPRAKAAKKELDDMIQLLRKRFPHLPNIAQPKLNLQNPHSVEVRFQLPDPRSKR